ADRTPTLFTTGVVVRHLPTLHCVVGVSEHVVQKLLQRQSTHQRGTELPVTREDPVRVAHRVRGAEDGRLLAEGADVEPDAPLPLQRGEALIQGPREHEASVDLHDLLGREPWIVLWVEGPVVPENAEHLQGLLHTRCALVRTHRRTSRRAIMLAVPGASLVEGGLDGRLSDAAHRRRGFEARAPCTQESAPESSHSHT